MPPRRPPSLSLLLAAAICSLAAADPRFAAAYAVDPPRPSFDGIGAYAPGYFLTTDPINSASAANPHTWNKYGFVNGNPLSFVDPDGMATRAYEDASKRLHAAADLLRTPLASMALTAIPGGGLIPGTLDGAADTLLLGETADVVVDGGDASDIASAGARDAGRIGTIILSTVGVGRGIHAALGVGGEAVAGGVQANKVAGDAFRDEVAGTLKSAGRDVRTEVSKRTPFGARRVDIEVSKDGKVLGGIETKAGMTRYLPSQRAKDAYLRMNGYPVDLVRQPKP